MGWHGGHLLCAVKRTGHGVACVEATGRQAWPAGWLGGGMLSPWQGHSVFSHQVSIVTCDHAPDAWLLA